MAASRAAAQRARRRGLRARGLGRAGARTTAGPPRVPTRGPPGCSRASGRTSRSATSGSSMGGAAGDEIDRADPALGTPPGAVVLATLHAATATATSWRSRRSRRPCRGSAAPRTSSSASDIVLLETPSGGAVFSAGSICFCGALSHGGYDNNISRMVGNLVRRVPRPQPPAIAMMWTWPPPPPGAGRSPTRSTSAARRSSTGVHRRRVGRDVRLREPGDGRDRVRRRGVRHRGRRPRGRRRPALVRGGAWSRLAPRERRAVLLRLADLIERDRDALATMITLDMGKPIGDAEGEVSGRRRLLPLLRRGGRQGLRRGRADRAERGEPRDARADRRGRPGGALELPAPDADVEARARARHRQLGRAQAGRAVPDRRARAGRARPRRRGSPTAWSTSLPGHGRDGGAGDRPPHGRRQGRVHRLERGRQVFLVYAGSRT